MTPGDPNSRGQIDPRPRGEDVAFFVKSPSRSIALPPLSLYHPTVTMAGVERARFQRDTEKAN